MADRSEMNGLEAGAMLAALPLDMLIATLGIGIAKAQNALDQNSLETAAQLAAIGMPYPDPDNPGETLTRSLISLGFLPTFYAFTEATLDLKIEMKLSVEENTGIKGSVDAKLDKGPVAIAGTVSGEHARKYGAESSAMTQIHVAMVSVPPPSEFTEFLRKLDATPVAAPALEE